MITAGVAIDDWKLSIFERHLRGAGYAYTRHPGLSAGTLTLKVKTENLEALLSTYGPFPQTE